jgi:S-DNA-T family DNA segregation ATPase FtsK/SpoIIIE
LIDPKKVEMPLYQPILNHFLAKMPNYEDAIITDTRQVIHVLTSLCKEMDNRYDLLKMASTRNLREYNSKFLNRRLNPLKGHRFFPYIVLVIDELADLMMTAGKEVEFLIQRLAQKARAAGIHLILATQRPSVDVITGLIKANIPTRIAFQVSSKIDSRTILDQMGAEALLGMGDMLYMPSGTGLPIRVHGAFVSDEEVHRVVKYLKEQGGEPNYVEGLLEGGTVEGDDALEGEGGGEKDPLYDQAVEVVLKNRKASISLVQRHLKIGYNRAARLVEDMENAGLVSSMSSSGQREILVPARPS